MITRSTMMSFARWLGALALLAATLTIPGLPTAAQGGTPQFTVNHPPRLQLGDAPLTGYAGSATDQAHVIWQTLPAGSGTQDSFTVEYRLVGAPTWTSAAPVDTIITGVGGRVNHFSDIMGLAYDTDYEYKVEHLRDAALVQSWQAPFHTRLAAGDTSNFTFAAYGDSADSNTIAGFRAVQDRINQEDPAFVLLLGDNVYDNGSHAESDARFDPTLSPEAAAWIASHIDYLGLGNHDVGVASGKASEDNFAVPIPEALVDSPVEPPATEREEHNFSFDYGMVHFATFDTNSLNSSSRLNNLLTWLEADLQASSAPWKIVYGHHPIAGSPDKPENPSNNYYQQVVPRLRAAGADLFMVGHSHTFHWTYPLLGQSGGDATFVQDNDKDYAKGAGLVQVTAGTGGRGLRTGSFTQFPFVVSGFSTSTTPEVEFGHAQIDVTANQLIVRYIAADDGAVLDQFRITGGPSLPQVSVTATDANAAEASLDAGEFTISRTGSTASAMTVQLTQGGTATEGSDFAALPSSVIIPSGQTSVSLSVNPVDDTDAEGDETLSLSIAPDAAYNIGFPDTDVVTIVDDDTQSRVFQQGVGGYADTRDTYLQEGSPNANNAAATSLNIDNDDPSGSGQDAQGLLRFENIIGAGAGQIPAGSTVLSAELELAVFDAGSALNFHRMLQSWSDSASWTSLGAGVQADGGEAAASADANTPAVGVGTLSIDVTSSLAAWLALPSSNHGWAILPTGTNGVDFDSAEGGTPPRLSVTYSPPISPNPVETENLAQSDSPVSGSTQGSYLDTWVSDDQPQRITERTSGGKKKDRHSFLEHRWTFDLPANDAATFFVEAYRTENTEGDDFVFAFAPQGGNFTEMLTVSKTTDDDLAQSYALPADLLGAITVRVIDLDQTQGNNALDTIFIDHMRIQTTSGGPVLPSVSVVAEDSEAAEAGLDAGLFRVSRSGSTDAALSVNYSVAGTASAGQDYQALSGSVQILVGQSSATIDVEPMDDSLEEGAETVTILLDADPAYSLGNPSSATVDLADDDQVSVTVDVTAFAESTAQGSVSSGARLDTFVSDNVYEGLTEEGYAGNKRSRLEHQWSFDIPASSNLSFWVEAHHDSSAEDFEFEYSTNGNNWSSLLVLTKGADDDQLQNVALPASSGGTVFVRVADTDRSRNEASLDTLFVDRLFIRAD